MPSKKCKEQGIILINGFHLKIPFGFPNLSCLLRFLNATMSFFYTFQPHSTASYIPRFGEYQCLYNNSGTAKLVNLLVPQFMDM